MQHLLDVHKEAAAYKTTKKHNRQADREFPADTRKANSSRNTERAAAAERETRKQMESGRPIAFIQRDNERKEATDSRRQAHSTR